MKHRIPIQIPHNGAIPNAGYKVMEVFQREFPIALGYSIRYTESQKA
jgi:hypothetical protein